MYDSDSKQSPAKKSFPDQAVTSEARWPSELAVCRGSKEQGSTASLAERAEMRMWVPGIRSPWEVLRCLIKVLEASMIASNGFLVL